MGIIQCFSGIGSFKDYLVLGSLKKHNLSTAFSRIAELKVRQFRNDFMKRSFLPKYEKKIVKISALTTQGRNPDKYFGRNDNFKIHSEIS